jgi:L-alanine-DL-glutamate epimerase-like enolase superfamily enzyme
LEIESRKPAVSKPTDVRIVSTEIYFLGVQTRVPLKFGPETLREVTCARARVRVEGAGGQAEGWGETPLSVQWVWPSALSYEERHRALKDFSMTLGGEWARFLVSGHPLEIGHAFVEERLPELLDQHNRRRREEHGAGVEPMPTLAALVAASAFDIALHDAFGVLHGIPVYETYDGRFMNRDLSAYIEPEEGVSFAGKHPRDFLVFPRPERLRAWHLVGGLDPLSEAELTGSEPRDGYPVLLRDWIRRDGLRCLKVKLRGDDASWDFERLRRVGEIAATEGADWLSADFNCTVREPAYVNEVLDRLLKDEPRTYGRLLYVEQPFPYDLEAHPIDVRSVSARKPLFMDESAHDWRLVRLGRRLGWSGVALKTCKTQTGALLALAWAKAHGMTLMVQDLTNPMLAQVPHVLLAAHAGTIQGVETNAMQFYPEASRPEAAVHPGLYVRRGGEVDLSTLRGPGFGYRVAEMRRELPAPAGTSGDTPPVRP